MHTVFCGKSRDRTKGDVEQSVVNSAVTRGLQRSILRGEVNFPVCMAPMVGLSHVGMRLIVRSYLPRGARTLWPTEMLNSRRLPSENFERTPETRKHPSESDLVPQILGNDERHIAPSVRKLEEWGACAIDINMGCPVRKALQHNYGVALMGDPAYAAEVVKITVRSSQLPVSVKLRAGLENNTEKLFQFLNGIQDAGASWITLHPRLASEQRRGRADWDLIGRVRLDLDIPVIGNGDVQSHDDALDMLNATGCDMVMVGRALTARPWLLWQVGERLGFDAPLGREGRAPQTPEEEGAEYARMVMELSRQMELYFEESLGLRKIRFFIKTGAPWLEYGHALIRATAKAQTYQELNIALEHFFSNDQRMYKKTALRQ